MKGGGDSGDSFWMIGIILILGFIGYYLGQISGDLDAIAHYMGAIP